MAHTLLKTDSAEDEPCFSCQATRLFEATEMLPWWDVRQYFYDVMTRNYSIGRTMRITLLGWLRSMTRRMPIGYRIANAFTDWVHMLLTGRAQPHLDTKIARGKPTPTGRLDLQPGELVRIKSQADIERTIDESGKNRGLSFDPEEMAPFCGGVFRWRSR